MEGLGRVRRQLEVLPGGDDAERVLYAELGRPILGVGRLAAAVAAALVPPIHPFRKGNHQVAHALTTLYLQELGYPGVAYLPWSFAMLGGGTTRDAAFVDAVTEGGDLTPWVRYLSGELHAAFATAAQRVLFRRELPRDLEPRAVHVAEVVARWDLLTLGMWFRVGDLAGAVADIPRRTLQRELNALCKAGVLEAHGTGSATKYGIRGSVDPVEVGMAMLKAAGGKP